MKMRFGVCASFEKLPEIIEAGYDYVEVRVNEIADKTDEEFKEFEELLKRSNIKLECFNCLFPGKIRLTGPNVDYDVISEYIEKVSKRMAALGAKLVVLGSGSSRKVPEGFDFAEAKAQFEKVCGIASDITAKYGITVALEPLFAQADNLLNTVKDAVEICKKINKPNLKVVADFFHMGRVNESNDSVIESDGYVTHLHLARVAEGDMPYEEDIPWLEELAAAVKKAGYTGGRLSLEGYNYRPDFKEAITRARKYIECFNN